MQTFCFKHQLIYQLLYLICSSYHLPCQLYALFQRSFSGSYNESNSYVHTFNKEELVTKLPSLCDGNELHCYLHRLSCVGDVSVSVCVCVCVCLLPGYLKKLLTD